MLNLVEVVNSQGDILVLPLDDEGANGYVVKRLEGLEPVNATLVSSSFANADGSQYHSSRREPRNLKTTLGFNPDWATDTVRTLRNKLYRFFMPKTEVLFRFHTFDEFEPSILKQDVVVEIRARIETCLPGIFEKDPVVDISLMAFDPDFVSPDATVIAGMSTAGLDETTIDYEGTVENGVVFTLLPDRIVDTFTVYHRPPDGTLRMMEFTAPLNASDILKISTVFGAKSVIRTRAGVETSQLYAFSPQNDWMELQPGENILRVYATGAAVPYNISYVAKYGGL